MSKDQLLGEIRETNLAYLLLAQQMIRMDIDTAMFRLGISKEVAEILDRLSPAQIMKMAASNMLMCRFRCDDRTILGLLTDPRRFDHADHRRHHPTGQFRQCGGSAEYG